MRTFTLRAKCLVICLTLSLLSACAELPDLKPFADATARMATAMQGGYTQTESLLVRTGVGDAKVGELRARWEPTRKAVNAMVAYSDALAALADAGTKGEESAGALISSLEGVRDAFGALVPGIPGGVPATIITAFQKINGVVARLRARKALKEIVTDADESLAAAATILSLNFRDLARINRAAGQEILNKLEFDNNALRDYHNGLTGEMNRITVVLTKILDYQNKDKENVRPLILADLKNADKDLSAQIDAGVSTLPASAMASDRDALTLSLVKRRQLFWDERVKYLQGELNRTAPDYDAYQAQRAEIKALLAPNALDFSGTVIETWASAHSNLKSALAQRQRVTVAELLSVVNELESFAKKEKTNGTD
jgi:hypothetical protein